jgi:hypothetical protein
LIGTLGRSFQFGGASMSLPDFAREQDPGF